MTWLVKNGGVFFFDRYGLNEREMLQESAGVGQEGLRVYTGSASKGDGRRRKSCVGLLK